LSVPVAETEMLMSPRSTAEVRYLAFFGRVIRKMPAAITTSATSTIITVFRRELDLLIVTSSIC